MPRSSAADAAKTARAILDHARSLLAEQGFAGVSVDDVARGVGVSRGAVYHRHRTKQELFAAVAEELQLQVGEEVLSAAETGGADAEQQLRRGCHAFLDAITEAPRARILLLDAPSVLGWARWRRMDAENAAAHLKDGLGQLGYSGQLQEAATAQLSGAMNDAALWIAEGGEERDARRMAAHELLDRLLDAVTAAGGTATSQQDSRSAH